MKRRSGLSRICLILFLAASVCCLREALFDVSVVYAGAESDGSDTVIAEMPGSDSGDVTFSELRMKPGETYDLGENDKATWMVASDSGTYCIKGKSVNTMLLIHAKADSDIRIVFGDSSTGCRMVATKDCPGLPANARSAITIEGTGGKVTLSSASGQTAYFRGKGGVPAIRKDVHDIQLVFETEDEDAPGTIEVHADPDATRTSAIGCFSNFFTHNIFGNAVFESGNIKAYGSQSLMMSGGPGIGADLFGRVDGLTFNNANVEAYAGSESTAAIGTASCHILSMVNATSQQNNGTGSGTVGDSPVPWSDASRFMGITCTNITINGGTVKALRGKSGEMNMEGGAGIGGGWGCHTDSIVINGGEVKAIGTGSAAGIGGGEEGNCNGFSSGYAPSGFDGGNHGIIIRGGKVYAEGGAVGIGSGAAYGMTDDKNNFRFGDCRIVIEGGEVTAKGTDTVYSPGIGGYKGEEYDPVMKVVISGGVVNTDGIGSGGPGVMQSIDISGGRINIRSETDERAAIGGDTRRIGLASALCKRVRISGGTVYTENKAGDGPGYIGGYEWINVTKYSTSWVYISGGNVYGKTFKSDARQGPGGDIHVYPNMIKLQCYGLSNPNRPNTDTAVSALGLSEEGQSYGLKDTWLFPTKYDSDCVMCVWLPDGVSVSSVSTDPALLEYGLSLRKEDVKDFYGMTDAASGGTLYPKVCFLFDDNYYKKGTSDQDPHAYAKIGDAKADPNGDFVPSEISVKGKSLQASGYTLDQDRKYKLMNADGTFVAGCSYDGTKWTDDKGRLVMTSANGKGDDARDFQNYYVYGRKLYSCWEKYVLDFEANVPESASTSAEGSMDAEIHAFADEITLPECGYTLGGYEFLGWAASADAEKPDHQPGDKLDVSDFDPQKTGQITLYAVWAPREYTITFRSGIASETKTVTQTLKFDETAKLKANAFTNEGFAFHGWTTLAMGSLYDDQEEIRNLCTFNSDGTLLGDTLTAQWVGTSEIAVSVTKDRFPVEGLGTKIHLIDSAGDEVSGITWDYSNGTYTFQAGSHGLPAGDYELKIDGFSEAGISYDGRKPVRLIMDYYTVQIADHDKADASVAETESSDKKKEMLVPDDTKLWLSAAVTQGYHFTGYKVADVKTESYSAAGVAPVWDRNPSVSDQQIMITGPVRLVPNAAANEYTLHFDANSGKGKMADQRMVYDQEARLYENSFSRNEDGFLGWNTKADGSGASFSDNMLIDAANQDALAPAEDGGTVTLYAQWDAVEYDISYDLAGGKLPKGSSNPAHYSFDDSFSLVAPVRKGYVFAGWTGTGLKKATKTVRVTKGSYGDRSYKAAWKKVSAKKAVLLAQGKAAGRRTIRVSWNKVKGASKYVVYGAHCGNDLKKMKVVRGRKLNVKRIGSRMLARNCIYKFRVRALDKNGKVIATSRSIHVIAGSSMGRYANIKSIKAAKKSITLKKGKTAVVKAVYTLPKGKRHVSEVHGSYLRYVSDAPGIASVDSRGRVKAKKKGTATIYIQDISGKYCRTVVTVK